MYRTGNTVKGNLLKLKIGTNPKDCFFVIKNISLSLMNILLFSIKSNLIQILKISKGIQVTNDMKKVFLLSYV